VTTFNATDDAGDTHVFTLVSGTGDTDNSAFTLSEAGVLTSNVIPDLETKSSYSIRVRATDGGGLFSEAVFTVAVNNVNEAVLTVALSGSSVNENAAVNTTVGTLSSTDTDIGDTHSYSLVSGTGSDDNASFNISGNALRLTGSANFEAKSSYAVRVRSTDQGGLFAEQDFTITVNDINESPTDISLSANSIVENNAPDTTVGTLSAIGDPDAGATHSFSFVAGTVARAPVWAQRTGLEWVHRLAQEPRRLARRYLVEDIPFAVELFAWALRARAARRRAGD
jgi:hypothetical protein